LALVHTDSPMVDAAKLVRFTVRRYPGADAAGQEDRISDDIAAFLDAQKLGVPPRVSTRVLDVTTGGGRRLQGVAYLPERVDPDKPVLLLVGGRTADTIQSSTHWMGLRLAAQGLAVFAPGLRVSGLAGFESSTLAEAAEDIGHWIDRLAALGHRRIVLTGHSNGGVWISNYMSLRDDPRVVGMVYFAPTRDTPSFAQAEEGAQYAKNLEISRAAMVRGDGLRVPIGLLSAQAWLDNNGPDSRAVHTRRVQEFKRPALVIAGQRDPLMTPAFLAEFKAAYAGPLSLIEYPDGSHGLRENKHRLGDDVAAWVAQTWR
jgi:pimeloyl-ACP methyl ester carboxylesterase